MKITKIDQKGIDLITKWESFKSKPYLCPAKVPTIGYGTTRYPNGAKVTLNDREVTKEQALSFLQHDVKAFELSVDAFCRDDVTQNQFNALVSFAYNLGSGALKGSSLLRKVNTNPLDKTIKDSFLAWVFADGSSNKKDDDGDGLIDEKGEKQRLNGLTNRRQDEANLYFTR